MFCISLNGNVGVRILVSDSSVISSSTIVKLNNECVFALMVVSIKYSLNRVNTNKRARVPSNNFHESMIKMD